MKTRMTFEEHAALGKELYEMKCKMMSRSIQLCKSYGSSRKATKMSERVEHAINNLRCEMDSQLYMDYPKEANPHVYYPRVKENGNKTKVV